MCSKRLFKKTRIKGKEGKRKHLSGAWVADFMLRQDARKCMLGTYLSDKNP